VKEGIITSLHPVSGDKQEKIMRRKCQFYQFTRVILVLALVACLCSIVGKIAKADQTVQKEPQLKTVSFGSSVEEVEEKLKCKSTVDSLYKPVGAVKEISCLGMVLRFDHDRLNELQFRQGFNFSLPISPFENPDLNPPREIKIFTGMTFDSFSEVIESWKSHLTRLSFHELQTSGGYYYETPKRKEFVLYCPFAPRWKPCWFKIGPESTWLFEFTKGKKLKRFSATDNRYTNKWAPSLK
jgi:hypothetical protein